MKSVRGYKKLEMGKKDVWHGPMERQKEVYIKQEPLQVHLLYTAKV